MDERLPVPHHFNPIENQRLLILNHEARTRNKIMAEPELMRQTHFLEALFTFCAQEKIALPYNELGNLLQLIQTVDSQRIQEQMRQLSDFINDRIVDNLSPGHLEKFETFLRRQAE